MNDQRVKDFSHKLQEALIHVLSNIHPSWIHTKISKKNQNRVLPLVLTGGGASLPMIKSLAKGFIELDEQKIGLHLAPAVPKWIEDEYEGEIIELYPQMAVAIGSAKKFIIEMTKMQEQFH